MRCPYPAQFAFNSLEGKRDKHWDILVVSARLENKMALLRILQGLPVSAFTAPTVQQAPTTPLIDGGAVPPPIRTSLADGNMENQRQTPKLVCPRCGSDWVCQSWRNGISARLLRSRGIYVAGSE